MVKREHDPSTSARSTQQATWKAGSAVSPEANASQAKGRDLTTQIGHLLFANRPAGAEQVVYQARAVFASGECSCVVHLANGTTRAIVTPPGVESLTEQVRAAMALPGAGTWFSMELTMSFWDRGTGVGASADMSFDNDHEPSWGHPVSPAAYVRDLQDYPRDEDHMPEWLRARVVEAGA